MALCHGPAKMGNSIYRWWCLAWTLSKLQKTGGPQLSNAEPAKAGRGLRQFLLKFKRKKS